LDVDYLPLQELLADQEVSRADKLNNLKLCELAGEASLARKWIYFTEVNGLPTIIAWFVFGIPMLEVWVFMALWIAGGKRGLG
jgi:hypothetical protein